MTLLLTLRQAFSTPPHIVARKIMAKITRKIRLPRERRHAYTYSSYAQPETIPDAPLRTLLVLPPRETLLPFQETLEAYCARYMQHRYDVLGSGWREYNRNAQERFSEVNAANLAESTAIRHSISPHYIPIQWQCDIRSGYQWSATLWWKDIHTASLIGTGTDPKVPWEIGRLHHLLHLALAHYGSQNTELQQQYRQEFRNNLLDFIASNPPQFGIQWKTAMDVAIRLSNMLVAKDLFSAQGVEFDQDVERIFKRSVVEHVKHIRHNLEWSEGMRGNHYLANICGLLIAACYLPPSPEQGEYLHFSLQELINETLYQFLPDGGNFEASLPYHRLSAEMLAWATAFALHNATTAPLLHKHPQFIERLHAIRTFTASYLYSSGRAPQIGDNDSGRFLPFVPVQLESEGDSTTKPQTDYQHHAHLLCSLNALMDIDAPCSEGTAEFHCIKNLVGEHFLPAPALQDIAFQPAPQFGIYPYRLGKYECCIRAGSIGQKGKGGHAHNDQLSFTLAINGFEVLADCGTYCYTPQPDERNRFRSTAQHNTLIVEGYEQNEWSTGKSDSLFWMNGDRAQAQTEFCSPTQWKGVHFGYPTPHRRSFHFSPDEIRIEDECTANGIKRVHFHCAPDIHCHITPNSTALLRGAHGSVEMQCTGGSFLLETAAYSRGYGLVQDSIRLVVIMEHSSCITHLRILG